MLEAQQAWFFKKLKAGSSKFLVLSVKNLGLKAGSWENFASLGSLALGPQSSSLLRLEKMSSFHLYNWGVARIARD